MRVYLNVVFVSCGWLRPANYMYMYCYVPCAFCNVCNAHSNKGL